MEGGKKIQQLSKLKHRLNLCVDVHHVMMMCFLAV